MQPSDKQSTNDHTTEFFHTLSQAKQAAPPEPLEPPSRRVVGVVLGAVLGLIYGLISQIINQAMLPGVPFAQYPFGLLGNCLADVVSGAIIGLACTIPQSSITGAFVGSIVAGIIAILQWLVARGAASEVPLTSPAISPWTFFEVMFYFMLFVPFMMIFRAAVDDQIESANKPPWAWARLRVPLLLALIIGVVGAFSVFPNHVQLAMKDMHALVQAGLSAPDTVNLPPALEEQHDVTGFREYATADYVLETSKAFDLEEEFDNPDEDYNLIVVARFKSNWVLACAYDENGNRLRCKSFVIPEFYLTTG